MSVSSHIYAGLPCGSPLALLPGSEHPSKGRALMLGEVRGTVRFKEPLSFYTSLRTGGAADIFVVPQDLDDVRHTLSFAHRQQLPVVVLGGGNKVLVRDGGIRAVVMKLEGCLARADFHGEEAMVGGGMGLATLIRHAAALDLGG